MNRAGPELLARLLDQHAAGLELYARQWCDSPEDIVQDALLELVRQPKLPDNVLAWLYRVVRNAAISHHRRTRRRKERETIAAQKLSVWFSEATCVSDSQAAAEALLALPIDQREVIIAH